jgi:hypothetical protein
MNITNSSHAINIIDSPITDIVNTELLQLVEKYNLNECLFVADYNQNNIYQFLDLALMTCSELFNIAPESVGQGKLNIDFRPISNDEPDSAMGFYIPEELTLTLLGDEFFSKNSPPLNEEQLNDLVSIFAHEYTHFLQTLSQTHNPTNTFDSQYVFEHILKNEWQDIAQEIYQSEYYSKEKGVNWLMEYAQALLYTQNIKLSDNQKNVLHSNLTVYLNTNKKSLLKNIKTLVFNSNTEELFENFATNLDALSYACKNQLKSNFQQEVWNYFEPDPTKEYFNNKIEIHARLVSEILFNENALFPTSLGFFLPLEESVALTQKIKPKLQNFNTLLLKHNDLTYEKNQPTTKIKI